MTPKFVWRYTRAITRKTFPSTPLTSRARLRWAKIHRNHAPLSLTHGIQFQYALSVEYTPCVGFVKASFLWSLYKLRSRNPWIKRSIIALQVISAIHMFSFTIIAAIPCWPIAKSWQKDLPGGCYNPVDYVLSNISIVIVTDFLVLLLVSRIVRSHIHADDL